MKPFKTEIKAEEVIAIGYRLRSAFMKQTGINPIKDPDVRVWVPYYIADVIIKYPHNFGSVGKDHNLMFLGMRVINGYEDKMIIAHLDAPFRNDERFVVCEEIFKTVSR